MFSGLYMYGITLQ